MIRRACLLLTCLAGCCSLSLSQSSKVYTIDTVIGGAVYDGLPATSTPLSYPWGLWMDRSGSVWLADKGNNVIRRFDPATGALRVVVGGGTTRENSTPVPGTSMQLEQPSYVTGDSAGNIFFTEAGGNRVHKLTPDGNVVTIVGTGESGFSGDGGPAQLAKLNGPTGIAIDSAASLYITDANNCRIRRVDAAGTITTFAGNGDCTKQSADGSPATQTALGKSLSGLGFDAQGNLYIGTPSAIRKIDAGTRIVTTFAGGLGNTCGGLSGAPVPATSRDICRPNSIVFDTQGNAYFTTYNSGVLKRTPDGLMSSLGGSGVAGLVRDASGNLIAATGSSGFVIQLDPSKPGAWTTVAGTSDVFDGPGRRAVLAQPNGACTDAAGSLYVADDSHGRIRQYDPASGMVTAVVGGGNQPPADGVAATAASFSGINPVFVDAQKNVFFAADNTIWKADARTGTLTRIAGQPKKSCGALGDGGPAVNATFCYAQGLIGDSAGNIYVSDNENNRVRRVDAATGIVTTIAGNGTQTYSGDGGPATAAGVSSPVGLAFDKQGALLIGTYSSMRRLDLSTGIISSVMARGKPGDPLSPFGDGARAVGVDSEGNIYANPYTWNATMIVQVRTSDSLIVRIAGGAAGGFFGDGGLASLARFSSIGAIVPDASGNVYVVDKGNNRVRKLTATVQQPALAVSPGTVFFTAVQGSSLISAQQVTISSGNGLAFNWTLAVSTTTGGNWLTAGSLSGSVPESGQSRVILTIDSSRLGVGTYRGTLTISAPGTTNTPQSIEVVLTVTGAAGAVLGLSQQYLNFQAVQGGSSPAPQTLSITNAGAGTLSWSASAETSSGGQWLRISSGLGTAPSSLTISADITGLAQGVYQGQIVLRNLTGNETRIISVVLTVTRTQPILLPTQTGFLFVGIEGSLVIGPQSFAIQNAGQGRMDWQVQVNLPAGGDWLRVSPTSGTSDAAVSVAPTVTLLVDPSKLRAGVSVGLLTITASGALNAPQTGIVLVNMLARGSLPVGTINPLGVIFTAASGASGALTQGISIASTGGQALQYLARTQTQAGGSWLSVTPEQGVLLSSAETAGLSVQAQPTGLSAGVYVGSVILSFGTGVTQEIAVALVVAPTVSTAGAGTSRSGPWTLDLGPWTSAAACAPRRLVIVETKLGNRFSLQSGWPIPMLVQAVDDCGSAVSTATVAAGFTGNEPPLVFQNLRNGSYMATWVPATKGSIGVTIRAVAAGLEDGVFQFSGTLGEASKLPLLYRDGWVNAASFDRYKPLAPGMIFSLFGSNLAEGKNLASQIPLPRTLGNIKATLGGYEAPLFYADGGQVNAQVPFELTPGVATLVVTGKDAAGAPGAVTIVNAQPGVFTVSQSGTGQGVVLDGLNNLVDSSHAVKAGEAVVIYATGLGATSPAVATGQAAPAVPPLALVTTPVKVTIGGVEAAVEFAGLAPGFVGLYQVNARVPVGVMAGNAVALVLTQNGVASNTVTIAVK